MRSRRAANAAIRSAREAFQVSRTAPERTRRTWDIVCHDCGFGWIAARDPALEVPCPQCRARVGSRCRKPSGHTFHDGGVHRDRDLAAHAARAYHPACRRWSARA